ncbi:MAG: urease accessory protein UreF [Hoeflea sp.]|uniref:urease accessory protein UreF n=1 Tax=Hoeflea sp. TaxID=1940281 RepID=UPI003EF8BBBF
MTDSRTLLRLLSWLSPVFPIGGFAYSAGLEQVVDDAMVTNATTLRDWLEVLLSNGAQWNDAVLFAASWGADGDKSIVKDLCDLAEALAGSPERHREMLDQGQAFVSASRHWVDLDLLPKRPALPVAIGVACRTSNICVEAGLVAYLHAFVSSQMQAAIRLSVMGQDGATRLLAELEQPVLSVARRAASATLEDLGSATISAEIGSMKHESLQPRLFLS